MVYQRAEVRRVTCLLATVDLTKPRVHLYERILQERSVEGRLVIRSLKLTTGLSARGDDGGGGGEGWRGSVGGWRAKTSPWVR